MTEDSHSLNFIEQIIADDLNGGLSLDKLRFGFPPEPKSLLP
jgi:glutaminyl-tRNA synthetase